MNRKIFISALFISIVIFIPGLYSLLLMAEIQWEHIRMEHKIESSGLQTIRLNKNEVIWLRKNKEILVAGKPFDIHSIQQHGSRLIITGLFDDEEKELMERLHTQESGKRKICASIAFLLLITAPKGNAAYPVDWPSHPAFSYSIMGCRPVPSVFYPVATPPPNVI